MVEVLEDASPQCAVDNRAPESASMQMRKSNRAESAPDSRGGKAEAARAIVLPGFTSDPRRCEEAGLVCHRGTGPGFTGLSLASGWRPRCHVHDDSML